MKMKNCLFFVELILKVIYALYFDIIYSDNTQTASLKSLQSLS